MKKNFIIDTNVLLADVNAIYSFDDNNVIIPLAVLEELDNQKNRQDEVGKNARFTSRLLDKLREEGNLKKGIRLPNGGILKVAFGLSESVDILPPELRNSKVDNSIIAFAYEFQKRGRNCVLVSKDINVRVKCDSLGIKSEDYLKMRVTETPDEIYRGVTRLTVPESFIDSFYQSGDVSLPPEVDESMLYSNQILVMKDASESRSAMARYSGFGEPLHKIPAYKEVFGLAPRNKEQQFALDLLLDDSVKLVTLIGAAGCGKSCLAIAAGMHLVTEACRYDKLIVSRPIQPMGKDIGYLPGTKEEKMEPWIAPIKDNLSFLLGSKPGHRKFIRSKKDGEPDTVFKRDPYMDRLFESGKIEVEAITYIRGRSIPNAFMILDEAQNLSIHELKTIITRVGEGTKIVLTGDIEQIDNVHVDIFTNGLTYAIEKFKDQPIAGHITLMKGERSHLATLGAKIL